MAGAAALAGCAHMSAARQGPIVIAHRGASGERPEHTLGAYALAIAQGTDFIEPDLVMTKDGVLVCRHENEISETTNIADHAAFADRRTTKTIEGAEITGWFIEDFTLAELKTLRCKERLPQLRPQNMAYDGQEPVATFAEAMALARAHNVGVYPELKHPSFLISIGLDPVPAFVREISDGGFNARDAKIYAQCFEIATLERLKTLSPVKRVFLVSADGGPADRPETTYAALLADMAAIAAFADGIGAEKTLVIPRDAHKRLAAAPTDLVARAHAAGLAVHVWTFRAENYFLPAELRRGEGAAAHGDLGAELAAFYAAGVDGVFSDFPAAAVAARTP
jgi:glycerophosphoryl diester phosphodiesterase